MKKVLKSLQAKISNVGRDNGNRNVVLIEEPLDCDILLGRGKISFNHVGNRRFRVFIALHLKSYMEASTRMEKTHVVNSVYEKIAGAGGRFLKEDVKSDKWFQVTPKEAKEKVGHALRDAVGMRVKMAAAGNNEANKGHGEERVARRTSGVAIAKARRCSIAAPPRAARILDPRFSKSCGDLMPDNHDGTNADMASNARQACLELQADDSDDELDIRRSQLSNQGISSDFLSDFSGFRDFQLVVDPASMPVNQSKTLPPANDQSNLISNAGQSTQNAPQSSDETHDNKKQQEDRSGELSIMSEATSKKWYELPSGEFSVGSVDTRVFDDADASQINDQVFPRHLVNEVSARLDHSEADDQVSRKKEESPEFRRKRNVKENDLSEEFSIMSLHMRGLDENGIKSEDFGLKADDFINASSGHEGLKSDDFCIKSEDFGLHLDAAIDASITSTGSGLRSTMSELSSRSTGLDAFSMRFSSSEMSILESKALGASESTPHGRDKSRINFKPRISWALDEQPKGTMHTVLEGSPLDEKVGAVNQNKSSSPSSRNPLDLTSPELKVIVCQESSGFVRNSISSEFGL